MLLILLDSGWGCPVISSDERNLLTMKRLCLFVAIVLAFSFSSVAQSTRTRSHHTRPQPAESTGDQNFPAACDSGGSPSFPGSDATPADSSCGLEGKGGAEANQNKAKNNFCASGDATPKTFDDLKKLQNQVANTKNINWGNANTATRKKGPTVNREQLQQMGEGQLVVVNGFVLIARQEGAESVNCGANVPNEPAYHDIHISLVPTADETNECNGIVVEMSPHHRPAEWTAQNVNKLHAAQVPVRVTGDLFFDSSHVPCVRGQGVPSNPKRFSLWEVHPIYKLEVCTANCDGDGTWVNLSDWVNQNANQ